MKKLIMIISILFSTLLFNSCSSNIILNQSEVDYTLPYIDINEIQSISDFTSIAFEWNQIKDSRIAGYTIYRGNINDKTNKKIALIKDKYSTHYVDTHLKTNSTYLYQFATISKTGKESQKSEIKAVSTKKNIRSVSYVHAISNLPRKIKIIWRPHPLQIVSGYMIYRNKGGVWKKIVTVKNRLSAEYIDKNLKDNTSYLYKIYAITFNRFVSTSSPIIKAKTKQLPKVVSQVLATKQLPKKIEITWSYQNYANISHFNIYRSRNSQSGFRKIAHTKLLKYTDTIRKNNTIYFYKISAVDKDNLESKINDLSGSMGRTLPLPLKPVIISKSLENNQIYINWESEDLRTVKFIILKEAHLNGSMFSSSPIKKINNITENSYVDYDIQPNSTYIYSIISVDKYGLQSKPTAKISIKTPKAYISK